MALADMRCVASRYLLMYVRSDIAVERAQSCCYRDSKYF